MRIKLVLRALDRAPALPLGCNQAVAGLIYRLLGRSSADFAARLHDAGFDDDGRRFKLFTFSRLFFVRGRAVGGRMLLDDPRVELLVGSPVVDFIDHLTSGLFDESELRLAGAKFALESVEALASPEFNGEASFRALSPLTESVRDERGRVRFLAPEDDWSEIIERNLRRKYRALYGSEAGGEHLRWAWDEEYLERCRSRGRSASALVEINGIKVRGWVAPFTLAGNRELIELGYEAGFGSRNSMGFGMAAVL